MTTTGGTALVTGSTRGIGFAVALRLMDAGYRVALNYSSDDSAAAAALEEARARRHDPLIVKADVGDPDQVQSLVVAAIDHFGRLDVLVNNAAVVVDRSALDMTVDEWDSVLNVNLRGAFLCAQGAARQVLTQESGGVILNIGSSTGLRARANGANTCSAKAGLMILTQCLALELAPTI